MDRTICANESSRGRGFSASLRLTVFGPAGLRGEGAGSGLRGSRHGGVGFCGLWRSWMCFRFTKTLWPGGYPPDPHPTAARRAHGARSAGQDHRMAHAGHTATANRSAVPSAPPPRFRGSIIRREDVEFPGRETLNRGYSYPSWGRVRALQAIPRPRIPPDRPQNAQNGRECGFPGFGGHGAWMPATSRPKTHPRADPQARAGQGQAPGGPSRITSAGSSARTGLRSAVAPATGFERWSTSPAAAPVAGRKRRGQRGQSPPPASAGDARSVAPRSTLACLP